MQRPGPGCEPADSERTRRPTASVNGYLLYLLSWEPGRLKGGILSTCCHLLWHSQLSSLKAFYKHVNRQYHLTLTADKYSNYIYHSSLSSHLFIQPAILFSLTELPVWMLPLLLLPVQTMNFLCAYLLRWCLVLHERKAEASISYWWGNETVLSPHCIQFL